MSAVFHGGIPTEPDVRKLVEVFGDLKPGDVVAYEQIASAIGVQITSHRFRTVLMAWRRRLLNEQNIDTEAVRGEGIRRLPEVERTGKGVQDFGRGVHKMARGYQRVSMVKAEELDEPARVQNQHVRTLVDRTMAAVRESRKELASAVGATPRLASGEQGKK